MSIYPTEKELQDIALIEKYCKGELSEIESNSVEARIENEPEFKDLFSWGEIFFDPAENFLYELMNEKEIEEARKNFQKFVDEINDPLQTVEEIARKLPSRFRKGVLLEDFFHCGDEVIRIKDDCFMYWLDHNEWTNFESLPLPVSHGDILKLLTNGI